jgi:hypothetical protein
MVQLDKEMPIEFEITLPGTETLLPRVQQLLTRITEIPARRRFECFFTAAAATIERLGDIDVAATEADDDADDTTYWDVLGPVVRHSLQQLGAFLTIVRREFPPTDEPATSSGDDDFTLDGPAMPAPQKKVKDRVEEVADLFGSFCLTIGREHRLIEEAIANDALVADRCNLLERLGEFRGRTRSGIGEMVFLAARLFAVVRKEDVVPFYKEDVESSLALRRGVTALRERVGVQRARLERLRAKEDQAGVRGCCAKCLGELDAFIRSPLFNAVRPADRRAFRAARKDFASTVENEQTSGRDLTSAIDGIEKFLDSLSLVNHRELLLAHDREIIASTTRHLDALLDAIASEGIGPARESLRLAIRSAKELAGRAPALDVLLRLIQHVDIDGTGVDEILAIEQLVRKQL